MLNGIEHFLNQVLIVLVPILIYHLFLSEKINVNSDSKTNWKLTLILLFMLFMNMSFPVEYSEGYLYDFRIIPFIVSFIYLGKESGMLIVVSMLIYRYIIGGAGIYVTFMNYSIATVLMLFIVHRFKLSNFKQKAIVANIVFWALTLVRIFALFTSDQLDQIPFMLIYFIVAWLSMMMVIYVIENVNQQRALRNELQRAERLNIISQLAASVAHEVRNPMTSVRGFLQLMSSDSILQNSHRKYIDIALNELDHAQSIINDYLSLAKPTIGEMAIIDISNEVIKAVELMSSYSLIKDIQIKTDLQESLFIQGNRDEIKQILVNIIKNGVEATENGGVITVNTYDKDHMIFIEIRDNGKGMSKSQIVNLGTPFYSTKETGTGIGLTICFQLIQSMKGKIDVQSEPGKGTMFIIQFPRKC